MSLQLRMWSVITTVVSFFMYTAISRVGLSPTKATSPRYGKSTHTTTSISISPNNYAPFLSCPCPPTTPPTSHAVSSSTASHASTSAPSTGGRWRWQRRVEDRGQKLRLRGWEVLLGRLCIPLIIRTTEGLPEKKVLVVGSGNSSMEIVVNLADCGARASIVVRNSFHILSRRIAYLTLVLLKYLPRKWADSFATMMSKILGRAGPAQLTILIVCGDLTKYGIQSPKKGPFALKDDNGKYSVIDVGAVDKIKSGEIKVLPGISSIKGKSTKQWLKGGDNFLNEDGLPKVNYPNHWKGINGLYCIGLAHKGLYGATIDAQNIAYHIKSQITH
ncbi:indole-3-pyruvate monooxygenase [Salvia divinorum]|uniref:indole-3-pyruvate monooxygenase n=1 Tax=Salvia divinorum TaxID=28513 RepID=A0ABD1IHT8_SALDI